MVLVGIELVFVLEVVQVFGLEGVVMVFELGLELVSEQVVIGIMFFKQALLEEAYKQVEVKEQLLGILK